MTDSPRPAPPTAAEVAVMTATIVKAATCGLDFGGWLAGVLARAAARLGSTEALLASRPGSWEAAAIRDFLHSTVGYDDEYLGTYAESGTGGSSDDN